MLNIDFTPLFWFGVIIGVIICIVGSGIITLIIWLILHLEWVS